MTDDITRAPDASGASLPILADLAESGDGYRLTVELPGVKDDDVHVELTGHDLRISAEKRAARDEEGVGFLLRERRYGAVARLIPLPLDIEPASIRASLRKGVLTVTIDKDDAAPGRTRRIKIDD
ncbi:MAG: Hsp20/alpha crystallin family protein [Pseudomonadota bacterium]